MIAEIVSLLEADLGWKPVDSGDGETLFRVIYFGMIPDGMYTPEVREMYEIQLFVRERTSELDTQVAVQSVCRLAFQHVSELLNANLVSSTIYTDDDDFEPTGPSASLIFQTVTPRRDWI